MNIFKIYISKQIILLIFLAVILNISRIIIFGSTSLVYILWNILLALIPFFISAFLFEYGQKIKIPKIIFIITVILWILFLPNAPYLVTDLIHLRSFHQIPALYDALLLFSSAWVGMLLLVHSLFYMERVFRIKYSKIKTDIIIAIFIFLTSFGVYLGRFLRFNSWDVFVNHYSVLKSVWKLLSQITINIEAYLYTFLFFIFIYLSYYAWRSAQ